ncbi:MAG: hypothetical protein DMG78_25805 [Acidobacteria bacterium]|nr:MAG: hypothetical protein DMG78_25805 [Acidobacteriota bacterium]
MNRTFPATSRGFVTESTNVSSLLIGTKRHSCLVHGCALSVLIVLLFASASAQKPKINPLAPKTESKSQAASPGSEQNGKPAHDLTPSDLEAFLDGVVPLQIAREDIAGAVITVVKDGKPFFAKGYGYSNVEKRIPVSPDTTLFRPGSISKLFNWTGIMQQVELGKLDLDRDVNDYLDFKIPSTFPKPITLRDIMTHTPGFEETVQELFVPAAANLTPLDQYVQAHLPVRIYPPFTTPAYSNYATTLAGYILQRVSGEPFDSYVEHHIFQPLEMSHSTTRQPLPEALQPLMSNGYDVASGPAKHAAFHDRALGGRPVQRSPNPPAGNSQNDAHPPVFKSAGHERDVPRLLRGDQERAQNYRACWRYPIFPQ